MPVPIIASQPAVLAPVVQVAVQARAVSTPQAIVPSSMQPQKAQAVLAPSTPAARTTPAQVSDKDDSRRVYVGTTKKLVCHPDGTFGFIRCGGTYRRYGRDVFIPPEECRNLTLGDRVSFVVVPSKHGKPQARRVTRQPQGAEDSAPPALLEEQDVPASAAR
eukprot:TRINITY_DN17119_c0_g1_i2.p2 TRINITY_DN17119_c0_g1~~TRINITY_DN17119_c0_g1_i2.p2  ORF type:complete len:162 (+),score=21.22 TRINITY_DN17119_c0_g1_i2:254-739(+)